jgi:hypothetical protein
MKLNRKTVLAFLAVVLILGVSAVWKNWDYVQGLIGRITPLRPVEIVSFPSDPDFTWWPISDNKSSLTEQGFSISGDRFTTYITSRNHEKIVLTDTGKIYDAATHQCTEYVAYENDPQHPDLKVVNACEMNPTIWALAFVKSEAILLKFEGEWFYTLVDKKGFHN